MVLRCQVTTPARRAPCGSSDLTTQNHKTPARARTTRMAAATRLDDGARGRPNVAEPTLSVAAGVAAQKTPRMLHKLVVSGGGYVDGSSEDRIRWHRLTNGRKVCQNARRSRGQFPAFNSWRPRLISPTASRRFPSRKGTMNACSEDCSKKLDPAP